MNTNQPLANLEEWEDFLKERYPEPQSAKAFKATDPEKKKEQFRNYEADARPSVREFTARTICTRAMILFAPNGTSFFH